MYNKKSTQLSKKNWESRKPYCDPETLMNALQDTVHIKTGNARPAYTANDIIKKRNAFVSAAVHGDFIMVKKIAEAKIGINNAVLIKAISLSKHADIIKYLKKRLDKIQNL